MRITSPAFENNSEIPKKYTCDGENVSPPLVFSDVPETAKSLVLIVDDPDAPVGLWIHWVLFNIFPDTKEVSENSVPENSVESQTSFGSTGYGGPCPPSGTHRYFFKLFSLDNILDLSSNSSKNQVETAMQGHIISSSELIGLYSRK